MRGYCDPYLCGEYDPGRSTFDTSWGYSCSQYCTSCYWNTRCPSFAEAAGRYTYSFDSATGRYLDARQPLPWDPCSEYDVYCKKRALAASMWG